MAPKALKNNTTNGCILPDKIPEGTILTTVTKKKYRLGKLIGKSTNSNNENDRRESFANEIRNTGCDIAANFLLDVVSKSKEGCTSN